MEYLEDILVGGFTRTQWEWWLDTLTPRDAHLAMAYLQPRWDWEDLQEVIREDARHLQALGEIASQVGEAFGHVFVAFEVFADNLKAGFEQGLEQLRAVGDDSLREGPETAVQDGPPHLDQREVLQLADVPPLRSRTAQERFLQVVRRPWLQLRRPSWLSRSKK